MSEANKAVVRRKFEELVSSWDLAVLEEILSETIVSYDPSEPEPLRGRDQYRASVEQFRTAFPSLHARMDDQIAEGDRVVTRWTATGRHDGDLFDIPATGKDVEFTGIDIHRVRDGRIVEEWTAWDTLGLLRQLQAVSEIQTAT